MYNCEYTPAPITHAPAEPSTTPKIVELERIPSFSSFAAAIAAAAAAANTGRKSVAVLVAVAVALTEPLVEPEKDPDELTDGELDMV